MEGNTYSVRAIRGIFCQCQCYHKVQLQSWTAQVHYIWYKKSSLIIIFCSLFLYEFFSVPVDVLHLFNITDMTIDEVDIGTFALL